MKAQRAEPFIMSEGQREGCQEVDRTPVGSKSFKDRFTT